MADDIDRAAALQATANASAAAVRKAVPDIKPRGRCHNPLCEMDVGAEQLFCDAGCGAEFEWERNRGAV